MSKTFDINLGEELEIQDFLFQLLEKYIQKEDGKFYDKDNKTLLSGKYTLDEKYSNQNTIFEIKFSGGELKESTYYYPTGKTLCSETWKDQCLVQSEMFHYNGITSQIENYEDGLCIFSKSFDENGEIEEEYNYKKGSTEREILDFSNIFLSSFLIKNWLKKGWVE
jgi:antitoxin component YwqK of YwqJK toxin-antitoxin module